MLLLYALENSVRLASFTYAAKISLCWYASYTGFSVRIQNNFRNENRKGRVEILNNGKWGFVCANGWDADDAIVVCLQTKLGSNATAIQYAYNQTAGKLWLSGVGCMGNESELSSCPHNGIGVVDDCELIAGVECFGK